jgi:hypothetical protein
MKTVNSKQRSGISIIVLILLIIICVGELAYGQGLKVGDEKVLMTDNRPGKAKRGKPAVAFGKDVFLAAWQEGWHGDGGSSRIHALRLGLDGKPLDAKSIEIAPCKTGVQENPQVAFFNNTFLVVWQDFRNKKDCDVLGARISSQGKVLDKKPISIAVGPRTQAMPNVAADDKGFMVVWHGFQGKETVAKVFARRVNPDGSAGSLTEVTRGATPLIGWNGRDHLLVCVDAARGGARANLHLKIQRMDTAGKILSFERKAGYMKSLYNSVCGVPGKGWMLMRARTVPDFWGWSGPGAQMAYSITSEGKLAADSPSEKYYDPKARKKVLPLNWLDTSLGKKATRTPHSRVGKTIWPYGNSALAADGQHCVAVWQRFHTGGATGADLVNGDIMAGRLDRWKPLDGEGGIPVAASPADEFNPAVAGNGSGKLVCVYEKIVDGVTQICARTIEAQQ